MARLLDSGLTAHRPRRFRRSSSGSQNQSQNGSGGQSEGGAPTVPDDVSKKADLLKWVHSEDSGTAERAQAVLDLENQKPEKDRRTTLVKELTDIILEG